MSTFRTLGLIWCSGATAFCAARKGFASSFERRETEVGTVMRFAGSATGGCNSYKPIIRDF